MFQLVSIPPTHMGTHLVLALLDLFKHVYFVTCTSVCKRVVFIQLQSHLVHTVFTMFVDLKTVCFKDCIETIQEIRTFEYQHCFRRQLGSSSLQLFRIPWRIHVDNTFFFKFRMSLYIKKVDVISINIEKNNGLCSQLNRFSECDLRG